MKAFNFVSLLSDPKNRSCLCSIFVTASLFCCVYFTGNAVFVKNYEISPGLVMNYTTQNLQDSYTTQNLKDNCEMPQGSKLEVTVNDPKSSTQSNDCENECRPVGTEALPEGIIVKTSNLEMRPMWGPVGENGNSKHSVNLLAIAVGMKQKAIVKQIVEKFLANDFVVMLFHYDGVVDEWSDLGWSGQVIHISAMNQTKWWFAKRFLHPDIVAEYDYIFLWDEDLRVENFHPGRYLSIVRSEGLEISQPALDPGTSEVHHQITARLRRSRVHRVRLFMKNNSKEDTFLFHVHKSNEPFNLLRCIRRYYKLRGGGRCDDSNTAPPCVGWVEMMAPVFSRAAWQCAWYMIQNDLVHAWGLDMQLGYCAQGDRTKNVGVVDSEYVVHLGLPTLGGKLKEAPVKSIQTKSVSESGSSVSRKIGTRFQVRKQSYYEMRIFKNRWNNAVRDDKCWIDPYQQPADQKSG